MDVTAIVGFLLGTVAGGFSGVLIIKRNGNKIPRRRLVGNVKVARFGSGTVTRQGGARPLVTKKPSLDPAKTETILFNSVPEGSSSLMGLAETAITCPGCGLVAPDKLMTEHFAGSPSHKNGSPKPHPKLQPVAAVSKTASLTGLSAEDSSDSVRQLLQMLVPPRAFGRRHGQRTFDPLSTLVQTGASRKNPLR